MCGKGECCAWQKHTHNNDDNFSANVCALFSPTKIAFVREKMERKKMPKNIFRATFEGQHIHIYLYQTHTHMHTHLCPVS